MSLPRGFAGSSVVRITSIYPFPARWPDRALGELWEYHGLIIPNRVGKLIDPSNLYHRVYKPLLQKAGLRDQDFTFHSLRHTFVTELF
jgi:integrase